MAKGKKRAPRKAKPPAGGTARLDAGWASFIGKSLEKRRTEALWTDPVAPGTKPALKSAKRPAKKRAK